MTSGLVQWKKWCKFLCQYIRPEYQIWYAHTQALRKEKKVRMIVHVGKFALPLDMDSEQALGLAHRLNADAESVIEFVDGATSDETPKDLIN